MNLFIDEFIVICQGALKGYALGCIERFRTGLVTE